ncbi:delta-1-pyrroline-5-carboxylate dehydrogenase, mitochondrial-like isoform X2 [Tubulanus polymorphus]|uniref:delta-1-pyrroline-5-carboxylate dehydrogenase, mitochondrial-like isoform X2 n=1 Tax=Tubulanus polymorphus TaxID=672921 RepID=UPI003DA5CE47
MQSLRGLVNQGLNRLTRIGQIRAMSSFASYKAVNLPVMTFEKGSKERVELEETLKKYQGTTTEVPLVIGDEELHSDDIRYQVSPFNHQWKVAKFSYATPDHLKKAIQVALDVRTQWDAMPIEKRADIFLKAADLMATKYRSELLATTMIGQGKTIIQAEIDAAAELVDFLRFNVENAAKLLQYSPISPDETTTNSMRTRGMDGFWAAVTPFNFTAIAGNLPASPAFMGNTVLWKPSDTAMLSNYMVYKIFREAGLPPGVINFLPAHGPTFGDTITQSPDLAGINFTGSVATFRHLWKQVGQNIDIYKSFPRLLGECGGKNFHLVHKSADIETVINSTIRSSFEFSGQKCSACSRLYVPQSMWPEIKEKLVATRNKLKLGSPLEFDSYLSAVIDDKAFARIKGYIEHANKSGDLEIIAGGTCDDSKGYFVEPTIVLSKNPRDKIMTEEIFGPVVSVYAYPDEDFESMYEIVNTSTLFALTGSIFAKDQKVIDEATEKLKNAAGNFYINNQSTGSVVGQQPFGGARLSGTNDKAGGPHYLLRFSSPQAIKQMKVPVTSFDYSYMKN